MPRRALVCGLLAALIAVPAAGLRAQAPAADCTAPQPVCDARRSVFPVHGFQDTGSGVLIEPRVLVTNRHIVADEPGARVSLPDGRTVPARVVPTAYPGDLILLTSPELPDGPLMPRAAWPPEGSVHVIGADINLRRIRAYPPGDVLLLPAADKARARLYTDAPAQPGNSGGALVNEAGALVAVVASGGENRNEAIPVTRLDTLIDQSGNAHAAASEKLGKAYRICTMSLEAVLRPGQAQALEAMATYCPATDNPQMLQVAGAVYGRLRRPKESAVLLERAMAIDPNGLNTRISLVITYFQEKRYADALPILSGLLDDLPDNPQVLRMAVQAGKWGDAPEVAERALELIQRHDPANAKAAREFLYGKDGTKGSGAPL